MPRKTLPETIRGYVDEFKAAEFLDVSVPALRADRQQGTMGIPYSKIGKRVRYYIPTLIQYAESKRVVPPMRADQS
jgi:hypothetical protein